MLTIKDLTENKELDRQAMANVRGGTGSGIPSFLLNIGSPTNAPKLSELLAFAQSSTGPQSNTNMQSDNDYNVVIGDGQVVNFGGNHNSTAQSALSNATNDSFSGQ